MPEKPNVIAGSSGPLVPLTEDELDAYLRLDTWTLTEALFILSGNRPPGFESSSELMSHFLDAYHLAVNSIKSGNLCREIAVAGKPHFIESPTRWFSWAEKKSLHVAEAVRTEMMRGESMVEKADAPPQGTRGLATKSSLNEDRPSTPPVSKGGTTVTTVDAPQPDAETPETRREQQVRETEARHDRWYATSQEIKADNKLRTPLELAWDVATQERKAGHTKANAETIKRRLNKDHKGWVDLNPPKENGKN